MEDEKVLRGECPVCGAVGVRDWWLVGCMLFEKVAGSASHADLPGKLTVKPFLMRRYCGEFVCCDGCVGDARTGRNAVVARFSDLYGSEGSLELVLYPYDPRAKAPVRDGGLPRVETLEVVCG